MFILLGVLTLFEATLTLPGIAGIILTVGMAVDANVLIFERIKEENKLLQDKLNSLSQEKDEKTLPTEKKSLDMIIEEITNELNDNIDETIEDIGNTEDMQ